MVGVNGTGKTTTIGKIAWHLRELGKQPLLVAGDTFRAAAVEQLVEWGKRVDCEVVRHERGGDPGAVVYDGIAAAEARGADVVIIDTAGRLHTQVNLMKELEKVNRVIAKQIPGAPHETLITIDATTGQNGLIQARLFKEAVDVSGVVLTKMDGTAKGGIALAISHELDLPIKLIGTGEKMENLQPFDPAGFTQLLFDDSLIGGCGPGGRRSRGGGLSRWTVRGSVEEAAHEGSVDRRLGEAVDDRTSVVPGGSDEREGKSQTCTLTDTRPPKRSTSNARAPSSHPADLRWGASPAVPALPEGRSASRPPATGSTRSACSCARRSEAGPKRMSAIEGSPAG